MTEEVRQAVERLRHCEDYDIPWDMPWYDMQGGALSSRRLWQNDIRDVVNAYIAENARADFLLRRMTCRALGIELKEPSPCH